MTSMWGTSWKWSCFHSYTG